VRCGICGVQVFAALVCCDPIENRWDFPPAALNFVPACGCDLVLPTVMIQLRWFASLSSCGFGCCDGYIVVDAGLF